MSICVHSWFQIFSAVSQSPLAPAGPCILHASPSLCWFGQYVGGHFGVGQLVPFMLLYYLMRESLPYFTGTILATTLVATVLCRYRMRHRKQISWGTVGTSSIVGNLVTLLSFLLYEEGLHIFASDVWREPKGGWVGPLLILWIITVICILPALAVSLYYRRRAKHEATQAA